MDQVQEIDVEQIMRSIRENIRRRRGAEGHPTSEKPTSPFDDGQAAADFAYLHSGYDIQHVSFASHRRIVGALVVAAKKALRKLLTPILERQSAYNAASVRVMTHIKDRTDALNRQHALVSEQLQDLRDNVQPKLRQEILAAQSQALHEMHSQLRPALDLLGQQPQFDYVGFEERFRGSEEDVKERQRKYLEHFRGAEEVLDIGCGRGEFLELLREANINARGVDMNLDMVLLCKEKGLDIAHGDAFTYLEGLPDEAVGGIFSAQVIEHLQPSQIIRLVRLCYQQLAGNGVLVLETINPQCLTVFAGSFYADFTHVWPCHPEAMRYLLESVGFRQIQLIFSSPVDPSARIPTLQNNDMFGEETEKFNRAAELLNHFIFGHQDYAIIGRK